VQSPYTHKSGAEIPLWASKNAGTTNCQCKIIPENERTGQSPFKKTSLGGYAEKDYIMLS